MTKDIFIVEACLLLRPDAGVTVENGVINWHGEKNPPSNEEVTNKADELQKKHNDQAYARARNPLYPEMGDQLDDLFKQGAFSADMAAKIKKVKDDNPKG